MPPSEDRSDGASTTAPASADDRRREPRAPIELRVEYKRVNSFFADYTKNISRGGTFIATEKPLPIGTEFVFRLSAPGLAEPLELRGAVAWTVAAADANADKPAGMGIRFRYRDDAERAAVHQAVEQLVYAALGPFVGKRLLHHTADDEPRGGG